MGVTIGLPFYNNEKTLFRALQSLFSQTYDDWELILVDDGSRDRSLEIGAAVKDSRVRVLSDGQNQGRSVRLNQIAELATRQYVCRMDADDLADSERLSNQVAYLDAHPDVDVVGSTAIGIDADDQPCSFRAAQPHLGVPHAVLRAGGLIHPSVMARRDWQRKNPYNATLRRAEDKELWVRTCQTSRFEQLPQPLHFYRETGVFDLANYRGGSAENRAILKSYGALVGRVGTARLVVESYFKETCYRFASLIGQADLLVSRRGRPLHADERARAQDSIARILATRVPGVRGNVR